MWDLVLLRRIRYPLSADAEEGGAIDNQSFNSIKQKFSVLILLRRLLLLLTRDSLQAASLHCFVRRFRFPAPNEKQKFSVFRFPFSVYFCIFAQNIKIGICKNL